MEIIKKKMVAIGLFTAIVLIAVVTLLSLTVFNNKSSKVASSESKDGNNQVSSSKSEIDKSNCIPAKAGLFTSDVTELNNINLIQTPIRVVGGNNIKTHSFIDVSKRSPVYAPMDTELSGGANYYETMGSKPVTKVQYLLSFNEGCDVSFWLDHIVDVPDRIRNAFPAEPRNDTQSVKIRNLNIKAGELIGYTNQEGSSRFDFGALNLKGPQTSLTSNPRFKDDPIVKTSNKYRFATCPYNLYNSAKQKVYKSLYDPNSDGDQEIIENICM